MRSIHILSRYMKIKIIVLMAVITFHLRKVWQFIYSSLYHRLLAYVSLCQLWVLVRVYLSGLMARFYDKSIYILWQIANSLPKWLFKFIFHQQHRKALWLLHYVERQESWCLRARFWHYCAWVQILALPLTTCVTIIFLLHWCGISWYLSVLHREGLWVMPDFGLLQIKLLSKSWHMSWWPHGYLFVRYKPRNRCACPTVGIYLVL